MDNVELVCVADTDEHRAREVSEKFSTKWTTEIDEAIEDATAVSIAVPTIEHFRIASYCLDQGLDVLVEKPLAPTLEEARNLTALAEGKNAILQVGHVERFNGAVRKLVSLVDNPLFIEAHRMAPYSNRGDDVGVVLDLMIHDLDIVLALVRSPVKWLHAVGVPVFSEFEDIANVRLVFENGCVANMSVSRISIDKMRKIRIFQRDAYISVNYEDQDIRVLKRTTDTIPEGVHPMQTISVEVPQIDITEPLQIELIHFIDSVRTRRPPEVGGKEACEALDLAHRISKSIREVWETIV